MNYILIFSLIVAALLVIVISWSKLNAIKPLTKGLKAPYFALPDQDGKLHKLSDFFGKKIIIYFYPKSNTPGCTVEACSFRDLSQDFNSKNVVILGISYDSPEILKYFKEKHHLPFLLLSDSDKKVAKKYGAYQKGPFSFVPKRITFLVNERGIITHVFENIDVIEHAQDLLNIVS